VVRWEPGSRERLRTAALDLFLERGFEKTTTADIAAAAGLTERSFFRHFADKREVLFSGQEVLEQIFLDGVAAAPSDAGPLALVSAALEAITSFFPDERREHSRRRQAVIDAYPALRERESLKLAQLAGQLGGALRARGIDEPAATLAAQSAVAVFGVSFGQWLGVGETRSLGRIQTEVMAELVALLGDQG
jgi:AcrR family transcriptional regulator